MAHNSHHLKIVDLRAAYKDVLVLKGVSLAVNRGEVVTLIGASGSGKSTLLRVLVGLLRPKSGEIFLNGTPIDYGNKRNVKAIRDQIAIVFQQFNLFQNMSALRNVTIAPTKIKKRDRKQVEQEARSLLMKVGLGDKMDAYPDELSGGQQQRVAIARALALKPQILLLDEVTSALDPELVTEVLDTIRLLAAEGMTMLIISHEMGFVREIASRVAFIDDGSILEIGSPRDIFDEPREPRTREFVGKILRH